MMWYYSKSGTGQGPVAQEELVRKIQSGEVLASDLVWKEGMADWQAVSQVAELSGGGAPSIPQPPPPAASGSTIGNPNSWGQAPQIPNYLWQSIVATLFCCMPFGVVAIVYAAKVDGLVARGDIAGAEAASKSAKIWVGVSVGCFILLFIPYIVLVFFGVLASEF